MTSCSDINVSLNELQAKIDAIPRIDENSIVKKAVDTSTSILDPKIASVGVVASGAVVTATQSASLATIAKEMADDALRLGGSLLTKIGGIAAEVAGLVSKIGGLLSLVLNILAIIATYAILQTQINNLQAENKALREYVNAAFGQANAAMSAANEAGTIANTAETKADNAGAKADFAIAETKILAQALNKTTTLANQTALKADQAIYNASQASSQASQAEFKATAAAGKAELALRSAEAANSKADSSILKSDTANSKADSSILKSDAALEQSNLALKVSEALATILGAGLELTRSQLANAIEEYYTLHDNQADQINSIGRIASTANQTANLALNKASNISSQASNTSQNNLATLANSKADVALANSASAISLAQQAINRPMGGTTVVQSTGINSSEAELSKFVNTQVNQSVGLRIEQIKIEVKSDQQILKAELIKAINPNLAIAAGITAQQARDEQLRQQPIIAGIQAQIASIPASINQVNQQVSQKVSTADLQGILNTAITQAGTISAQQVEGLRVGTQNIITPIQNTVASTVAQVGVIGRQATENLNLNQQGLIGIAGMAAAVRAMPLTLANSQEFRAATTAAAKTGTCQASQPGGCGGAGKSGFGGLTDDLAKKADMALQAGQGALLASMNSTLLGMKAVLGTEVLVGGIAASLGRFMSSSIVDRAINLVTCAGVIHNCLMLSNSIQESFFSVLDNIVAIPQLIKDPNGATIDTKQQFTKTADTFFSGIFGASEYAAIKAQWKSYSTIYGSAAQIFGQTRDIFQETQEIQYTTSNWVAELGNGLTDEGIISEDNWDYKDDDQKPKGRYFGRLDNIRKGLQTVENVFEDLEQITQSARSIVDSANEIKQNSDIIKTAITTANSAAKADREAKVEGLELPNFSLDNLF